MDHPIKVENGTDNINENGGGDFGGGINGDVKKEHKSEHKSKDHKSKKNKHKDKERSRDHKSSHKDKHRSKDHKSHKSSSKDKDKDRQSSSSRKDGDKDRHREKDRHRDKDKHREDKDRHREDKGRHREDKEKHLKDKDKHREEEEKHRVKDEVLSRNVEPKLEVKDEPPSPQPAPFEDSQDFTDGDDEPRLVIKEESFKEESEDDAPLSVRTKPSVSHDASDSEEDKPLSARKKVATKKKRKMADSDDEFSRKPVKKAKKESVKRKGGGETTSPTKKKKEEEKEVWKWWEEKTESTGEKWRFLEHKGPLLAPDYELLPSHVKFFYNGQHMKLSHVTEEVATFYSKMLDHDYTTRDVFNQNFFKDWRKSMTDEERETITHLKKCDFTKMAAWFKEKTEERKAMSKEDRKKLKETNEAIVKEYGFCALDGHTEKIGNFRVEPPGLFRGRGDHPKQGMVKRRILAKNVIINCSKDSVHPKPPPGQKWKEVRHDNSVTWLASWTENIQGQIKYVMLNAASRLKGEKDWQKYEVARRLNQCVNRIRESYKDDFKSKEMRIRQRAVAMYFIDKLALRAGNEKDEDQADTVGCCSLRVEHIKLEEELNGKAYVVVFDFLGKDSIRYYNEIPVEKRVFKNLQLFTENKEPGDDLFDRLNTTILNKHLTEQMDGLTAKVFRTYNASRTLQEQLDLLTEESMSVNEKILAYNRANRAVAILCNHQRAVPKTFEKSMENLMKKIADKKETLSEAEKQLKAAKRAAKSGGSVKERSLLELKRKAVDRIHDQLKKLELSATDKEENKEISLGTSKLNYLDPRISVAWCKKWDVPIEKVYNKTQRDKFRWAIDMAGPEFVF